MFNSYTYLIQDTCLLPVYDKKSRAIANILPAQFFNFYETHFNAKIEHEDNFFIELDLLSFLPTKNNTPFHWNRSHDKHVWPAPYGGGLQFLPALLD